MFTVLPMAMHGQPPPTKLWERRLGLRNLLDECEFSPGRFDLRKSQGLMGRGSCQSPRFATRAFNGNRHVAASLSEVPQCFALLGLSVPAITCCAVRAHVPPPEYPMHKKRAQFPLFCTLGSPGTGIVEYMKRKNAPIRAHLHSHVVLILK